MARAGSQTSRVSGGISVSVSLDLNALDYDLIKVFKGNLLSLLMLQRRDKEVRDARAVTGSCWRRAEAVQQLSRSHVLSRLV